MHTFTSVFYFQVIFNDPAARNQTEKYFYIHLLPHSKNSLRILIISSKALFYSWKKTRCSFAPFFH